MNALVVMEAELNLKTILYGCEILDLGDNMFMIPTDYLNRLFGISTEMFTIEAVKGKEYVSIVNPEASLIHWYLNDYEHMPIICINGFWTFDHDATCKLYNICMEFDDHDICIILCDDGIEWSVEMGEDESWFKGKIECKVEWNDGKQNSKV